MMRLGGLLGCAAVIFTTLVSMSYVYAQSDTPSALLAYKDGITPEQENADRTECHDWAVTQSGFDPKSIYPAFIVYEAAKKQACVPSYEHPCFPQKGSGTADIERLNGLYDNYLKAGQVCLEGKGYTVAPLTR